MQLDDWQAAGERFDFNGHAIFYRDAGEGPILLCIHGFPTASWDWNRIWPGLTARWRAVAPDMLGFGFSAKPRPHDYSIHEQATLHERLLDRLDVERVDLLAHDYGTSVAQELIARGRVRAACLLNGGILPGEHRPRPLQRLLASPVGALVGLLMNERRFSRSFAEVFGPRTQPSAEELHAFWKLLHHEQGHRIGHRLIRYIRDRERFRERWVGALDGELPIRLIWGPEDPVSGRHMAERYLELYPEGDVVWLEGIGHYPQVEAPDAVLDAANAFWDRLA